MYKVPKFSAFEAFSELQLLKTNPYKRKKKNLSKGSNDVEDFILKFYNCTLEYLDLEKENSIAPRGGEKKQLTYQRQLTK